MRPTSKLLLMLVAIIAAVSLLFTTYRVWTENQEQRDDLNQRAEVLAESLAETVQLQMEQGSVAELPRIVARFGNREHLAGIAVYNAQGKQLAVTPGLQEFMPELSPTLMRPVLGEQGKGEFLRANEKLLYVYTLPLRSNGVSRGGLLIVHDASYIEAQQTRLWRDNFWHTAVQVLLVAGITLLVVRWSILTPIVRTAQWMRSLRTGKTAENPKEEIVRPLVYEMEHMARSLQEARAAAATEARLRDTEATRWTAERLAVHVRSKLDHSRLFAISNREPYMHRRSGAAVECIIPASGLVTALEPILRACDGTWIAHGSGDADLITVDEHDRLRVPPEEPRYTLRRVWLTREEDKGYYAGFSNEGLWPLCHIAHTRPVFRAEDWEQYREVNQRFARIAADEMADTRNPVVLVQDYHFALLPRMLKKLRPDARVAIFWHIPWPNPEAFGICPWQRELLDGLLGADLVGFHIQAHCLNFLETVDRTLEARIEWERFTVNRQEHVAAVRPFPISVEFSQASSQRRPHRTEERAAILKEAGPDVAFLGVGVDRVDYTKGILERFRGIERFLEKYPGYLGRFAFLQIGAPSRLDIQRYHDLFAEVEAEAARINNRFGNGKWRPIVLRKRHHSHEEIRPYYRAADVCLVTSLHDGMNLVSKEFLASREDESGVLILSRFAGASYELADALIVNPYDTEQLAETLRVALEMEPAEKSARMMRLRRVVGENNIYRWAGDLISELAAIRIEKQEPRRAWAQAHSQASAV